MNAQKTIKLLSGNDMPIIGIGTWELTHQTAELVAKALELGFRMVDTSGDYGTQPGVGDGIRASKLPREQVFLTTKVEETDDTYQATREDLDELAMQYVDLMLLHRPPEHGYGRELWEGLIRARNDGLAKDIGVSNYAVNQIQALIDATGVVPAVNQIEWTPFGHDMEMLEYCQAHDIVIQAYSPLTRAERLANPVLQGIADGYDKTPSQILLRWNIQLGVVPIVKAGSPEHLAEDIDIFDFKLTDTDMEALNTMNEDYSALGSTLAYAR